MQQNMEPYLGNMEHMRNPIAMARGFVTKPFFYYCPSSLSNENRENNKAKSSIFNRLFL